MNPALSDIFVSVVAPLSHDAPWIEAYLRETASVLANHYTNYEIVLVDDGTRDGTIPKLRQLLTDIPCTRVLQLSRAFGRETAVLAGLDTAIGDYVVIMLPEFDPPVLIPKFVALCRSGAGVVAGLAKPTVHEPFTARLAGRIFRAYCKRTFGFEMHPRRCFYRCLSRAAVNAVLQVKDKVRHLRHLSLLVGFVAQTLPYEPQSRSGATMDTSIRSSLREGISIVLANSKHPLRLASWIGLAASGANLSYMLYIALVYILKDRVAEGWTTLSLQTSVMFFLLFVILTAVAEYVALVLQETRERPAYFIAGELVSNVVLSDTARRNVVRDSS